MKDPVVQEGDPVLRAKAKAVAAKDIASPAIKKLIAKMKKVLAGEDFGVALAAPQIGEPLRIFVIAGKAFEKPGDAEENGLASPERPKRGAQDEETRGPFRKHPPVHQDRVFINPQLMRLSRKVAEMSEGCLSVRGKYGTVMRHEKASVKAQDEWGKPFVYHGTGLIAHIFQHEVDHLDGILYIDKAVKLEEDEDLKSARAKLKQKHGV